MRRLLLNETNVEANAKLISVEYDGLPVTARKIASVIRGAMVLTMLRRWYRRKGAAS